MFIYLQIKASKDHKDIIYRTLYLNVSRGLNQNNPDFKLSTKDDDCFTTTNPTSGQHHHHHHTTTSVAFTIDTIQYNKTEHLYRAALTKTSIAQERSMLHP